MKLLLPEGEKTENKGTFLTELSQQEKKTDTELLSQIDGKLDLLLQAAKAGTEE